MSKNKLLILSASVILLILVLLIAILTRTQNLSGFPGFSPGGPTPSVKLTEQDKARASQSRQKTAYQAQYSNSSSNIQARISHLAQTLPYTSADVDIDYDKEFNVVLVSFKSNNGPNSLKQYLANQNVLDIYLGGSPLFHTSTKSISSMMADLRDPARYDEYGDEGQTYPWLNKLPLRSDKYYVYFDTQNKTFVIQYKNVAQSEMVSIRQAVIKRLTDLNIPVGQYSITDQR